MRQLNELAQERDTMATVVELTGAFEGIASMHISQIKDRVLASQKFFDDLWNIYKQLRVDEEFHFGRHRGTPLNKDLIILVTAEGSFSGDIDQRVVSEVIRSYSAARYDVVVVGTHGATQLVQHHIPFVRSFKLPVSDTAINVAPLVELVQAYHSTTVFYPAYISLTHQEVRSIQMSAWVAEHGRNAPSTADEISERNYIFEPSTHAVIDHLERSMINIMLGQIIMESKLAQYASRFAAMSAARDKADESLDSLKINYNSAKRRNKDERAKEIINSLRKAAK
jgi:F-type H+-transporting ATPase subunit gamma